MQELASVNHTLLRIIAVGQAIDAGKESVAVGHAPSVRPGQRQRGGHARGGIGVRARPFRHPVCAPGQLRIQCSLLRQAAQHGAHGSRIIPRALQIGDTQRIGLAFLPARVLQREELAAGREDLLPELAKR